MLFRSKFKAMPIVPSSHNLFDINSKFACLCLLDINPNFVCFCLLDMNLNFVCWI